MCYNIILIEEYVMAIKTRREYMSREHIIALTSPSGAPLARDHWICKEKTKVCRPGKTAQDKARKHHEKN